MTMPRVALGEQPGTGQHGPMLLGRQPLLRLDRRLAGYEIRVAGGSDVGADVLLGIVTELGRRDEQRDHVVMVEVGPELVTPAARSLLVAHDLWLGVGAGSLAGLHGTAALQELAGEVELVVDDPVAHPQLAELAEHAGICRLRWDQVAGQDLADRVATLRRPDRRVLVTGVDNARQRDRCAAAGVDLVQGSALTTVEPVRGARVRPDTAALVRLLSALATPDVELTEVVSFVRASMTLSFQFLRLANSAALGLRSRVDSVERAVQLLGRPMLRELTSLLLLRSGPAVPAELARTALVRAAMAEQLGVACGDARPVHHTVGMLSSLDVIFGLELTAVVGGLPVTDEVAAALLRHEGPAGRILQVVRDYERFAWDTPAVASFDGVVLAQAYFRATREADEILDRFEAAADQLPT